MDPAQIGMIGIFALLVLLLLGVHIGVALLVTGVGGLVVMGVKNVVPYIGSSVFNFTWVYEFIALPLFILMSALAMRAGIAEATYGALYKLVQRLPGSLAIATTFGCAVLGAVSGSSMAVTAVFGRVSLPEMKRYGYSKSLSLGVVAAAGTFACMIPPSTLFIIYAIFTETSIGRLFLAGVIPGIITACVYVASIIIRVRRTPALAPILEEKKISWHEKIAALKQLWSVAILALVVLGGIYLGVFTVTEGAGIGCVGAVIIGVMIKGIRNLSIVRSLQDTAHTTAMIFFIIIGALFFSRFLSMSQIPVHFSEFLSGLQVPREFIILAIFGMYFVLGMFIVPSGMMAITLPVIFPVVLNLGYDPIWFGVIVMKANEIAAVTPPVGLNVYVLKGVVGKDATLEEIFYGIWPFVVCDLIVLGLLVLFPRISLWLPDLILGK